jgi:hypothetical protein
LRIRLHRRERHASKARSERGSPGELSPDTFGCRWTSVNLVMTTPTVTELVRNGTRVAECLGAAGANLPADVAPEPSRAHGLPQPLNAERHQQRRPLVLRAA